MAQSPRDPDDEEWRAQEARDAELMSQVLNADQQPGFSNVLSEFLKDAEGHEIDQSGKADDAVDFEDIDLSDEDLGDEGTRLENLDAPDDGNLRLDLPALTDDDGGTDTDDLFGDPGGSSPIAEAPSSPNGADVDAEGRVHLSGLGGEPMDDVRNLNFDHDPETNQDPNIPPAAENLLDAVKQAWPLFEENVVLNFNELLPPKKAEWVPKKHQKPPKSLVPVKLSLELDTDQEKTWRVTSPAAVSVRLKIKKQQARGLVCLEEPEPIEQADFEVFDMDEQSDSEAIGGYTMKDMNTLCDDWEAMIELGIAAPNNKEGPALAHHDMLSKEEDDDWFMDDKPPAKKRKMEIPKGLPEIALFTAPSYRDFEGTSAKLGKRVILNMNDPYLLIDDAESDRAAKRRKVQHKMVRMVNGKMGRDLTQRFNFSNDDAYEALKENHSGRIRATLSALPVDHSLPAQRLAWPYFRVKLARSDPHSFHRPQLSLRKNPRRRLEFQKAGFVKRRSLKGKKIPDIFRTTRDMSLNDNSTAVLWEYCEEIPTVLSNFGMGQRIINYYRRAKSSESSENKSQKRELGEQVLLAPEDRSPFSIFGQVHAGEIVSTMHNAMFRAPIFKHTPKANDFVVGRSTTARDGDSWYMRKVDHIYVVGQTLPLMDVPGPHSRKVTNMAKNRLKMVSYRLIRKHKAVDLREITRHIADSNESQNRQKLKEFLRFRKETRDWALPEGEEVLNEPAIRQLVKPEEVCLLDAMQVGAHELENSGYEAGDNDKDDGVVDPTETLAPDALARKMTPWITTKNFIDACHGKAMLTVHGAGDPTGRGLGVSFLKTSMKGGFLEQLQGPLATSADAIERQRKANNGHLYNVKNQESLYTKSLADIWARQRHSLQDAEEHDDEDVLAQEDEDDRFIVQSGAHSQPGHSQVAATPLANEGMSQISRSVASGANRRKLKITRQVKREDGSEETVTEIVHDPNVVQQYMKKRKQREIEGIDIYNAQLTGDPEKDRLIVELAEAEQARLEKCQERRKKREKQKKLLQKGRGSLVPGCGPDGEEAGSPEPTTEKAAAGTTRKCANCGQIGHIKTNRKLCPLLNGSISRDQMLEQTAGLGSINAPSASSFFATA